ncbi:ATP-binding protein [Streptomyces sp. TRM64462]|uniref:ATP-binding protein n=1 Tax=Streptomyces sp. TRM64462 TaxID=2741726 RepID=UPI0015868407|nr:ATP-binding protein [Streptomyces sp. TRM64462]
MDVLTLHWNNAPSSVGRARRALRTALAGWNAEAVEDEAVLVLSELLTNAVQHAQAPGRPLATRFTRLPDGGVRIEVHDASEAHPKPTTPQPPDAEAGRGLHLVTALAASWGVTRQEGGKTTWAELKSGAHHDT